MQAPPSKKNVAQTSLRSLSSGAALHHGRETESTNSDALTYAQSGGVLPAWFLTDEQTAGRGRAGKGWASRPGNVLVSYVFSTHCDVAHAPQLAFVSGLAVYDTVTACLKRLGAKDTPIQLKWPNDVLVDGDKIAGLLVETSRMSVDTPLTVVIGIGLNIAATPAGLDKPATSLHDLVDSNVQLPNSLEVLQQLDLDLSAWLMRWRDGTGWRDVRTNWIAKNGLFGRRVTVQSGDTQRYGVMKGLDETGALLVETKPNEIEHVTFGDITLTPVPPQ